MSEQKLIRAAAAALTAIDISELTSDESKLYKKNDLLYVSDESKIYRCTVSNNEVKKLADYTTLKIFDDAEIKVTGDTIIAPDVTHRRLIKTESTDIFTKADSDIAALIDYISKEEPKRTALMAEINRRIDSDSAARKVMHDDVKSKLDSVYVPPNLDTKPTIEVEYIAKLDSDVLDRKAADSDLTAKYNKMVAERESLYNDLNSKYTNNVATRKANDVVNAAEYDKLKLYDDAINTEKNRIDDILNNADSALDTIKEIVVKFKAEDSDISINVNNNSEANKASNSIIDFNFADLKTKIADLGVIIQTPDSDFTALFYKELAASNAAELEYSDLDTKASSMTLARHTAVQDSIAKLEAEITERKNHYTALRTKLDTVTATRISEDALGVTVRMDMVDSDQAATKDRIDNKILELQELKKHDSDIFAANVALWKSNRTYKKGQKVLFVNENSSGHYYEALTDHVSSFVNRPLGETTANWKYSRTKVTPPVVTRIPEVPVPITSGQTILAINDNNNDWMNDSEDELYPASLDVDAGTIAHVWYIENGPFFPKTTTDETLLRHENLVYAINFNSDFTNLAKGPSSLPYTSDKDAMYYRATTKADSMATGTKYASYFPTNNIVFDQTTDVNDFDKNNVVLPIGRILRDSLDTLEDRFRITLVYSTDGDSNAMIYRLTNSNKQTSLDSDITYARQYISSGKMVFEQVLDDTASPVTNSRDYTPAASARVNNRLKQNERTSITIEYRIWDHDTSKYYGTIVYEQLNSLSDTSINAFTATSYTSILSRSNINDDVNLVLGRTATVRSANYESLMVEINPAATASLKPTSMLGHPLAPVTNSIKCEYWMKLGPKGTTGVYATSTGTGSWKKIF